MYSNDRPSPYYRPPYHQPYGAQPPRPCVQEDTLKTELIHIERKSFQLTLKENPRGRFLRITEDVGGKRDTIIIPATGLAEFKQLLDIMVRAENGMAAKDKPAEPPVVVPDAPVVPVASVPVVDKPVKRTMSEAARAKISAAAKARWAKIKSVGK